uniref:hematopoietic SH2 domain-containing protein-like n=1 Tax=Semicossyphus pulcher TaxID=241346 RepID=UPI0037E7E606
MIYDMSPVSHHTLQMSRKGIERNFCVLNKHKPRSERICHFSGSRTKDQRGATSSRIRTCLTFCFKDQPRMEKRGPPVDSYTEGRLRELSLKWFIETQVPFIVNNGFLPSWFLGFITRKDAEEMLREKELGCFLIRLSDKAIGYILSYKGRDRCRHFVISQSESGKFVVCGGTEGHDTLSDLIEYYKNSSIQPFGEYLTSSCFEALHEDLYDIIQVRPEGKPAAIVRDVKNVQKQQIHSEQPPTRPPRTVRAVEEVPPLPRRSRHLDAVPLNKQDIDLYAQLRKKSPMGKQRPRHILQDNSPGDHPTRDERSTTRDLNMSRVSPPYGPGSVCAQLSLLDSKSRSLPLLEISSDGDSSYRLSAPPYTPRRLSPEPVREATSYSPQPERTDLCGRPRSVYSTEHMKDNAVYHLAGRPGSPHTASSEMRSLTSERHDSVYAELPNETLPASLEPSSNTYEPLEDIRPKHNHSSWGLKNDKWKWLFPDVKRKW